ncbi:MAG: S-layer homology domain-containing protein [Pseudoflavonifractor sp.]
MRNLKRVLSLALASTMLLGMMVIGAGAVDYKDAAKITHEEAVAVTSAIGVFQGDNNGNFMPTAELTRESAAKVICYALIGKAAADKLTSASAPFNDVKADRWSAGSIAYCVSKGIIAGNGAGGFNPEATVAGTDFAKMLLTAAGYNATIEGLVGAGYDLKVADLAITNGLTKGLDITLSAKLTREQAAQMVLNLMSVATVTYTGGTNINNADGSSIIIGGTRNPGVTFKVRYFPKLTLGADSNSTAGVNYGRPSVSHVYGSKAIGTYPVAPVVTFNKATKIADVNSVLTGYVGEATSDLYVNGVDETSAAFKAPATINAEIQKMTGAGRLVEVYATTGNIAQVVVIDTFLAKIASINTVGKVVSLTGTFGGITVTDKNSTAMYKGLSAMAKDDRVLVTFSTADAAVKDDKVVSIAKAPVATGMYDQKTAAGKLIVGGTSYDNSYLSPDAMAIGTEYDLYLDGQNNILGYEATESATVKAKNGYVLNTDLTGSVSAGGQKYKALVLFADGTQEWVDLAKVNGAKASSYTVSTLPTAIKDKFVSYTVKTSGAYEVTAVTAATGADKLPVAGTSADLSSADTSYALDGNKITKNSVNFITKNDASTATKVQGSSKTVFLVGNSADGSYKAYTGVKNIPGWNTVAGQLLVTKNTTTASMVVIYGNASTASTSDLVYLTGADYAASYDKTADTAVYTFSAIRDGAVPAVDFKTNFGHDVDHASLKAGLYVVNAYDGDYAHTFTRATDKAAVPASGNLSYYFAETDSAFAIKGGNVYITGHNYVTADNFKVIAVNKSGVASEISADDLSFYASQKNITLLADKDGFVTTAIFTYGF